MYPGHRATKKLRDAIGAVIPEFYHDNARIAELGGFRMDTPASRREWRTAKGKANFIASRQHVVERENQPAAALRCMIGRPLSG